MMMRRRMMFSEIIGFVELTFLPNDMKLVLANTVMGPIESHIDCFGSFLLDCIVGDTGGGTIVADEYSRWLWVA